MKKTVLGLVGPTASGKTAVSIALAKALGGEILCMDSMQIYRRMDIGTAKPTAAERAAAPHHLLDVCDPKDAFSVTEYAALARPLLDALPAPILVGGTGFYLRALSLPLDFGFVKGDEAVREKYQTLLEQEGKDALHDRLLAVDPKSASKLHPNDTRRVIRALEVYDLTGKPFSSQKMPDETDAPYDFQLFAIDFPRETLYARIERRVDEMMEMGLLSEVEGLLKSGVPLAAQSMQGLGYKELAPCILEHAPLADAVALIKQRTRNYAKRQLTWFRADKRIRWIPFDLRGDGAVKTILQSLEEANIGR